ncbi:MAG: HPF/RaiA family ribosome-associated protein [Tsuneonella sp.]
MLVQINTDSRVDGSDAASGALEEQVRERLIRFSERLTRVEVHLRDRGGDRNGPEGVEVSIEIRPSGGQPIVVSDRAPDSGSAMAGALRKAIDSLDRVVSKKDAVR